MSTPRRSLSVAALAALVLFVFAPAMAYAAAPGDLDPTFGGGDGVVKYDSGGSDFGQKILRQPDGKIVVAGQTSSAQHDENLLLARYTADGKRDTTFGGGDGVVSVDFLGGYDDAWGLARMSDGRLVVAGEAENPAGTFDHVAVARFTSNGHLDTTFSGDGKTTTGVPGFPHSFGWRCVVQPNGKIVVVGEADNATGGDLLAVRYQESGALDPTFSGDGRLTVDLGGRDGAWDVRQVPGGGSILAAGWSDITGEGRSALVWITSSGTLDQSHGGGDGKTIVDVEPNNAAEIARAAFVLGSGKIMLVGDLSRAGGGHGDLYVARVNANGALDTTFGGGDGVVLTDAGGDESMSGARRTSGGTIVVGGETTSNHVARFLVVRFKPNGSPDPTFGTNGFAKPFPTS
ncbi:MAG TPA: hypothetical protein VNN79_13075, partial [Actinomycetota bacterium]|nr:hypothetical protein [Actinomycetota bacterium]